MKTTEQQHNERKREMMEKCFECYAENGLTGTGIKALADACGCTPESKRLLMRADAQRQIFIRILKTSTN